MRRPRRDLIKAIGSGVLFCNAGCLSSQTAPTQSTSDSGQKYPRTDCFGNTLSKPREPEEGDLETTLTLEGDGKGNIEGERVRFRNISGASVNPRGCTIQYSSGESYEIEISVMTPREALVIESSDVVEAGLDQCPQWMIRDAGFNQDVLKGYSGKKQVKLVNPSGVIIGSATAETGSDLTTDQMTETETQDRLVRQASDGTVIQDNQSDDRDALVLTEQNWRDSVNTSELTDETAAFLDGTDFESNAVVLVEYSVTSASNRLRLQDVKKDGTVRITFKHDQPENGVQGEGTRLLAVRIERPAPDSVRVCPVRQRQGLLRRDHLNLHIRKYNPGSVLIN